MRTRSKPTAPLPAATEDVELPQLRSLAEAAGRLCVCVRTLRREIHRGNVRVVRFGKQLRISESEIRRLVAEGTRPLD
jgi:excisionase family DNA binding protein